MKKAPIIAALLVAVAQAAPAPRRNLPLHPSRRKHDQCRTATTVAELLDPPLTALGQQQALDLGNVLASYDLTTLYTSAYQRTQQTTRRPRPRSV